MPLKLRNSDDPRRHLVGGDRKLRVVVRVNVVIDEDGNATAHGVVTLQYQVLVTRHSLSH